MGDLYDVRYMNNGKHYEATYYANSKFEAEQLFNSEATVDDILIKVVKSKNK